MIHDFVFISTDTKPTPFKVAPMSKNNASRCLNIIKAFILCRTTNMKKSTPFEEICLMCDMMSDSESSGLIEMMDD